MRKQGCFGPQELEERVSIARRDAVFPRDLRAAQHLLRHLLDLARNQKEHERPATPGVDELPL